MSRSDRDEVELSGVIGALSYALDLTEGQPMGHCARTCLIGMRIAEVIELPEIRSSSLFYALLMKDLGCSSNAARVSALFDGDDGDVKRDFKLVEPDDLVAAARYAVDHASPGRGMIRRAHRVATMVGTLRQTTRGLIEIRCERGAEIATMVGLSDEAAAAIRSLDEHWNGTGHPVGLSGDAIPLLSRIMCLAQTVEVFFSAHGRDAAYAMAEARSARWFDPALVAALATFRHDLAFWSRVAGADPVSEAAKEEPGDMATRADGGTLDMIAEGFARVIDAKSPYTARHSDGVARFATGIGSHLGFCAAELSDLRRAALLHDIGKLGVSNRILDKAGRLDEDEWRSMRLHPHYTLRILHRVPAFRSLAEVSASHHERMDGAGYHRGIRAGELTLAARVLPVADVFEALTADRPYRAGMPIEQALGILHAGAGTAFCPVALDGFDSWLSAMGDGWALAA